MDRNFDEWLQSFRSSISDYKYYVNFEGVYRNVDSIKIELNILNSLIGTSDFDNDFKIIVIKYPQVLKCIPILLAVRQKEIEVLDIDGVHIYNFNKIEGDIDQYIFFLHKTGLAKLISKHVINNLVDYVLGVEVGLDSNGRKNRGGHRMEDLLESYIKELNVSYYKEMNTKEIERKWNIDLSKITNSGDVSKRFDFVIHINKEIYVFETNFYKSGGSKLNETARSYKTITQEVQEIEGVTFIWVTDGKGWKNAKKNLKETFDVLDTLYNIHDLENGVLFKTLNIENIIDGYKVTYQIK